MTSKVRKDSFKEGRRILNVETKGNVTVIKDTKGAEMFSIKESLNGKAFSARAVLRIAFKAYQAGVRKGSGVSSI